ncbi:radical SAM family heme chaperone HemW [Ructibacterium gallinarum]|uniref:Heme chaperone HemW n=1 Tax=Ructibacterium gallinarum TaxID=2779355 RepID=A0A9D5M182_9FIRM|nr:radical SAM family heme chaperone HemW [Ructibacterium gallinarum]MBE5040266.1 radical SAM family heme chaperone HemW [Ructibacterium gallinarum]
MCLGIYVHIPFCASKCNYCDFNSYAGILDKQQEYCEALSQEIRKFHMRRTVDTVYFGGGTPTLLQPERLVNVFCVLKEHFPFTQSCEVTAECNPGTIDFDGLKKLRDAGFNRLSIGMQSASDEILKQLGRIHNFEDCRSCVENARRAGFQNLSVDLIFGLPEQTKEDWMHTLKQATALSPQHISCYALKIEPGTPFADMSLKLPDDDLCRMFYDYAVEYLDSMGYIQYEISNFAFPGYESRHNCKYWQCDDFAGFGAGAYSCINTNRYNNVLDVSQYCKKIFSEGSAVRETVLLTPEDRMSEFCFLGLRMNQGIDIGTFQKRFHMPLEQIYGEVLQKNYLRGTLRREKNRIYIPKQWLFVCNSILVDFV